MAIFVDSSAWYAAADRSDTSHERATQILDTDEELITSDHVLVESWLLFRGRADKANADSFWSSIRRGVATVAIVGAADLEAAWSIGETFADQDFSLVDMTSFAVMRRLGIDRVASFDNDFAVYRFGPGKGRAFTVLR